jgi:3-methyladenine DNA glycosylase Tag
VRGLIVAIDTEQAGWSELEELAVLVVLKARKAGSPTPKVTDIVRALVRAGWRPIGPEAASAFDRAAATTREAAERERESR